MNVDLKIFQNILDHFVHLYDLRNTRDALMVSFESEKNYLLDKICLKFFSFFIGFQRSQKGSFLCQIFK